MTRVSFYVLARRSFQLMVGAVLVWCGGILGFITGLTIRDELRYMTPAHTMDAHVTSKLLRRATEQTSTAYLLTFRLDGANDIPVERTEEVPAALWESVEEGGTVPVEYITQPERDARIRRARQPIALYWTLLALGVGVTATGAFLSGSGLRRITRQLAIARTGHPAEAVVTAVRETNYRINRVTQWAVDFEYRDDAGRLYRGDSGPMPPHEARQWRTGDKSSVKFDTQHPERHIWTGR